ncbi:MAG: hypothetical protein MJZ72_02330 [Bacteroidales bacterium]|nr:hypothetical protein [Bacteroidales bacterium]
MRQYLFYILLFIFPLICKGQAFLDSLPSLQEHEILLLGENHFGRESQDMELDIISHYVHSSQDTVVVFIEDQYSGNYFIHHLFETGDSLPLHSYLRRCYSTKAEIFLKRLISRLYQINKKTGRILVYSADRVSSENDWLQTVHYVLSSYADLPLTIQSMKTDIETILPSIGKEQREEKPEFIKFLKQFDRNWRRHKKDCRQYLSAYDCDFIDQMIKSHTKSYDVREEMMCDHIIDYYKPNRRFISINGITHTNKLLLQYYKGKYDKKTKPLAWQLNNRRNSPFLNGVLSIGILPTSIISPETKINDSLTIPEKNSLFLNPQIPPKINKILKAQKRPVAFLMIDSEKYPEVFSQFDGFILIKDVHSTIPGNDPRKDEY